MKEVIYVCGRCGYRANSKVKCPTCNIYLEEICKKCLNAKGNCICDHIKKIKIKPKAKQKKRK